MKPRTPAVWTRNPRLCRLAVACSIASLATGCKKEEKNAYAPPPPPTVIVAAPVERDVTTYRLYTGTVEASEYVELRARVQGFLEEIRFKPGQVVNSGDLLFVIDKRAYQAAVDKAAADVQARAATVEGATNDAKMARELANQNAGPAIDAIIKAARRDAAIADLAAANAALAEAKLNLEYCEVKAPTAGRITKNFVDIGNLVGRGEPTLLAQIVQATPAYVSIDAPEADVLAVRSERERLGAKEKAESDPNTPEQWRPCELALANDTEFRIKGRVDYVDPQLNRETGTLRIRTRYDNTDLVLLPGFFARVRFPVQTSKALLVPEAALLSDQQGRYGLVVNGQDEVEVRRVHIGVLDGEMRVVEDGLRRDDRVIVLGVLKARPGSKVTPKTQEAAPPSPASR